MTSTFVVTGATGAIGGATATVLAEGGARLILLCRDVDRGKAAADRLGRSGRGEVVVGDLSSLSSIRRAVEDIAGRTDRLTGLVNDASVFVRERRVTDEGFEVMFATNHLGPFLLTNLLLPLLHAGAPSRIVTVTAPSTSKVNLEDLQSERAFNATRAFGATKAENVLFTFALARRLDDGVTADAIHPGLVRSGLTDEMPAAIRTIHGLVARDPGRAGRAIAGLVAAETHRGATGRFFKLDREAKPPKATTDQALQEGLWEASARLSRLDDG
jgi:NAD(P)-dependent dehydrogenase (short-subunit alcohol dehydrogenase family)